MERVLDPALPETVLSLVERAARDWRQQVLDDLGGLDAVSATKRALLDAATGSMILLASLDAYVFELAGQGGGEPEAPAGRTTYEGMAVYWPTDEARAATPAIAERMNRGTPLSNSKASWQPPVATTP